MELTSEEQLELSTRPISPEWRDFTEDQIKTRVEIGKKFMEYIIKDDITMEPWAKEIYTKMPMWGFYIDPKFRVRRRVFGALKQSDSTPGVHAASAHFLWTNYVIGGVPINELERIDRWTEEDKMFFKGNNCPGLFLDPLGFIQFISENNK